MANKIILKKSNVSTKVPLASDLEYGELALNYRDGALWYKDYTGTVKNLLAAPPSGSGSGSDADFLDGIDSTEFLRSNTDDQYTNGTLTFNSGTTETFAAGATVNFNNTTGTAPFNVLSTTLVTNLNADFLDGRDSTYFYSPDNPPPSTNEQDTLQTVTERGNTTDQALEITNTTASTSSTTGALIVDGGVGIAGDLWVKGVDILNYDPNAFYVSDSGSNSNDGQRPNSAFATLAYALTQVSAGDTITLLPGTYTETFPLTIPQGVTVKGSGIRSTIIKPSVVTNDLNCFLMNGETTVEDLTVKDMFYNGTNDTGYAFSFASGCAVTERSPYVQRVTVLNKGSVTSSTDPYGFNEADAGRGAKLDGALVTRASLEAAILFNECTFIVPNSRALVMTNGARTEWLNCFTYFADLAIEGVVGPDGRGADGKTYITLEGLSGSWLATNTISLYDTDGTTVLASATIESVSGSTLTIDGSASGFIVNSDRTPKTVTVSGDAQLDTAIKKFGTASLLLDGTGDYIDIDSSSDFDFGTGNWTIDFWVYRTSSPGTSQTLVDMRTGATQVAPLIYLDSSYQPVLNVNGSDVITAASAVALNTWTHIEIAKSGTSTKLFIGGTQSGSTYTDNNDYIQAPVRIGADYTGSTAFTGQIDEFRISKDIARHTTTFTPENAEYSSDADTVLLLHFNGTDGAVTILDDGQNVQDLRSSGGGTATGITRYDRAEFAAEMRAISGANVYGNQGVKADGADVVLQLMAHNFAYIGTGADLTNDKSSVVQASEVIEVNGGKVYYNSVDQAGDFRVGDYFKVNFETGAVTFSGGSFDVTALGSINFVDGTNQTTVNAAQITTGNLVFAGSTISTNTGDITIDPAGSADIYLNGDVIVAGNLSMASLTHTGLVMSDGGTSGTNSVDTLVTYTKSLTITTDWQDTGIAGGDLATGTYIMQLYANDVGSGGTSSNEYYSGTMSWYAGATDSSVDLPTDEIQLHRAGASSDAGLYLRTYRSPTGEGGELKLQIYSNLSNASASNYVFKFRRMI